MGLFGARQWGYHLASIMSQPMRYAGLVIGAALSMGTCSSDKGTAKTCSVAGEPATGCNPVTANHRCLDSATDCACQISSSGSTSINVVDCTAYCDQTSKYPVGICNETHGCVCGAAPDPVPDGKMSVSCGTFGTDELLAFSFGSETTEIPCQMTNTGKVVFNRNFNLVLDVPDPLNAWLEVSNTWGTVEPGQSIDFTVSVNRGYFDAVGDYSGAIEIYVWNGDSSKPLSSLTVPVTVSAPFIVKIGQPVYQSGNNKYVATLRHSDTAPVSVPLSFEGSGNPHFEVSYSTSWLSVLPSTGDGPTDLVLSVTNWNGEGLHGKYGDINTIGGVSYRGGDFAIKYAGGIKRVWVLVLP